MLELCDCETLDVLMAVVAILCNPKTNGPEKFEIFRKTKLTLV